MEWTPGGMSSDVEDRRDDSGGGGGGGGGFGFGGGGGIGIVGFLILLVLSLVTGRNFLGSFLHGGGGSVQPTQQMQQSQPATPQSRIAENRDAQLISFVLDDVQKTWTGTFQKEGKQYRHAKLVLFRGSTYSGCGTAQASTGPFYCPADEKVYIDLDFWNELKHFGGSTAEFAQAYVIAHELGHHVQKLLAQKPRSSGLHSSSPANVIIFLWIQNFRLTAMQVYGRTLRSSAVSFRTVMSPRL